MEVQSQERFMMEHLRMRISEMVADYESRLGLEALRLSIANQELERTNQENHELRMQVESLEQQLAGASVEEPRKRSSHE